MGVTVFSFLIQTISDFFCQGTFLVICKCGIFVDVDVGKLQVTKFESPFATHFLQL